MNSKILTIGLLVYGLLLLALVTRNGDLAWMAMPFLFYLGLGIYLYPSIGKIHLLAERSLAKSRSGSAWLVEMVVTIHNQGIGLDHLQLSDPYPFGAKIIDGSIDQTLAIRAGGVAKLKYTFRTERGSYTWRTVRAVASDPFGLVETELKLPAGAEVQIQPGMKRFRLIPIRPHNTLHSTGSIPARLGGSGTDFWGVREYHPGDSLRWLDWRLTARHPRKFFSKEFEQEEIADIGLVLDARQKIDLHVGEDSLFEHSVSATASLAESFLRQGHRVSLLIYGERMIKVFPGYGKLHLHRILRCLARATIGSAGSLDSLEYLPLRMFSKHSLLVVVSPLTPSDWPLFPRLRAFGFQGLLISPDPVDFLLPGLPDDPVSRLAIRATRIERQLELRDITRLHIPVINWQVRKPLSPLLRNTLLHHRVQRENRR